MPLVCDLKIENGEFSWERDVPGGIADYSRSPIDFHHASQVAGTPFFDEDQFIIKFNNFSTIELPPGYSLLVTHPINREDLPFTTLTGLVDVDLYSMAFVHFPRAGAIRFQRHAAEGDAGGAMPAHPAHILGGGIRDHHGAAADRFREIGEAVAGGGSLYRQQFRATKR